MNDIRCAVDHICQLGHDHQIGTIFYSDFQKGIFRIKFAHDDHLRHNFLFVCLSRLRCCVGGERDISALFASINCDAYTIGLFEVLLGLHNWTLASVVAVSRLFVLH